MFSISLRKVEILWQMYFRLCTSVKYDALFNIFRNTDFLKYFSRFFKVWRNHIMRIWDTWKMFKNPCVKASLALTRSSNGFQARSKFCKASKIKQKCALVFFFCSEAFFNAGSTIFFCVNKIIVSVNLCY